MTAVTSASGVAPTRQEALQLLLQGVAADHQAYQALQALLELQFTAALRRQAQRLNELAEEISVLVETMETRRAERVALAQVVAGIDARMADVYALLKPEARTKLEADWLALETMAKECKRMGKRNTDLMVEQYSIMQRVLHGDNQIYEPI
ncbi:MAG: flagellar protein FlgN [Burkholderiaceae bacterium]|nr:flagellar protein FlgN [Burkholderiaceae bacterium]